MGTAFPVQHIINHSLMTSHLFMVTSHLTYPTRSNCRLRRYYPIILSPPLSVWASQYWRHLIKLNQMWLLSVTSSCHQKFIMSRMWLVYSFKVRCLVCSLEVRGCFHVTSRYKDTLLTRSRYQRHVSNVTILHPR